MELVIPSFFFLRNVRRFDFAATVGVGVEAVIVNRCEIWIIVARKRFQRSKPFLAVLRSRKLPRWFTPWPTSSEGFHANLRVAICVALNTCDFVLLPVFCLIREYTGNI